MQNALFKVAFPTDQVLNLYDPARISFMFDYKFFNTAYSPLLEYTPEGKLVSGVAESFNWKGNEAHFQIRKGLKTIDGQVIDAEDVAVTIKRLFVLGGGTHGDLRAMLCKGSQIDSLDDSCPNMEVRNSRLLVMKFAKVNPLLFSQLTTMDFVVIPKHSIDKKSLKIIDYRNTSGPYYVTASYQDGRIELAANPNHYHYRKEIPQRVLLIPAGVPGHDDSIAMFKRGQVDFITTADYAKADALISFAKNSRDANLHMTQPLNLHYIAFTRRAREELSIQERFRIGKIIKHEIMDKYKGKLAVIAAQQIFPALGEGALTKNEVTAIDNQLDEARDGIFEKRLMTWYLIGPNSPLKHKLTGIQRGLSIGPIPGSKLDYRKLGQEEPHLYYANGDVGYNAEISMVSYYLNYDFFHLNEDEKAKWLEEYVALDKRTRLQKLRRLHYETLINADVVPLMFMSYAAVVRKPWHMNFSEMDAGCPIWRITRR